MYYNDKIILDHHDLADMSYRYKAAGYIVGTTNGCFDLLHPGHVEFLNTAYTYCDALIVLINSDDYIETHSRIPIYNQHDRLRMVASLGCVTFATIFNDEDPSRLIRKLYPNIHFNHTKYGNDCVESGAIEAVGGELILINDLAPYSTTDLISRIKEEY